MTELQAATREVGEVHDFIQAWIRGELPGTDAFFEPFAARFTHDFALVGPGGVPTPPGGGVAMVRDLHGTNPAFEIWITEVSILRSSSALLVVRYIEWQRGAIHSETSSNSRWSTAVFDRVEEGLRWAWLHETWRPSAA